MSARTKDLCAAVAIDDFESVDILLQGAEPPAANEADETGHTALFYAQLLGHRAIAAALVEAGWTSMPETNLFQGAGGRLCFWDWCAAASKPVPQQPIAAAWAPLPQSWLLKQRPSTREAAVRARRGSGRAAREPAQQALGPDHSMYVRKHAGGTTSRAKALARPWLNVADLPEMWPRRLLDAARACSRALDREAGEVSDSGDEAADAFDEPADAFDPALGAATAADEAGAALRGISELLETWLLVGVDEAADRLTDALDAGWADVGAESEPEAPDEARGALEADAAADDDWLVVPAATGAAEELAAAAETAVSGAWRSPAATLAAVRGGGDSSTRRRARTGLELGADACQPRK